MNGALRAACRLVPLSLLLSLPACYIGSYRELEDARSIPATTERTRLVVMVPVAHAGRADKVASWMPLELALLDRNYVLQLKNERNRYNLFRVMQSLHSAYAPGRHPTLEYIPFTSDADAVSYKTDPRNALEIRLYGEKVDTSPLVLGTCLTVGIIPYMEDYVFQTEVMYFDRTGRRHTPPVRTDRPVYREWIGWIFLIWGPIVSDNDMELPYITIQSRINETADLLDHYNRN